MGSLIQNMVQVEKIVSDNLGNEIRTSSALNFEDKIAFRSLSVKYVRSGSEFYTINGRKVGLTEGELLIGNRHLDASVSINSKKPVQGICIDLSESILNEVIDCSLGGNEAFKKFLFEKEWLTNKYQSSQTNIGFAMRNIAYQIENSRPDSSFFKDALFYATAESVVTDLEKVFSQFKSLKAVKEETNGRLLNFIYDAKNFIDKKHLEDISIAEIAKASKLSQYHFIRLFKKAFQITPHQYLIEKRLDHSRSLLLDGETIADVAYATGFSNPANFSRAFKNYFGISPKFANSQISNF